MGSWALVGVEEGPRGGFPQGPDNPKDHGHRIKLMKLNVMAIK